MVELLRQLGAERVHVELALLASVEQPVDWFATEVAYTVNGPGACFGGGRFPDYKGEGVVVHEGGERAGARAAVVVQVEIAGVASESLPGSEGLAAIAREFLIVVSRY